MKPATSALFVAMLLSAAPALAQVIDPPIAVPDEHDLKAAHQQQKQQQQDRGVGDRRYAPAQDWSPSEQEIDEFTS